jgi:hypothetical protein
MPRNFRYAGRRSKQNLIVMRLRIGLACVFLLLPLGTIGAKDEGLSVLTAEPFVLDLWPDRPPATASVVDRDHPLSLRAARGQDVAGVLVLTAGSGIPPLQVVPGDLRAGEAQIPADRISVAVIRSVRRTRPQGVVAAERYPGRAGRGIHFPEILVRDEPAFEAAAAARKRPLPDEDEEAPVRMSRIRAGSFKYLLVTVAVPEDAAPGEYSGRLAIGRTLVPIKLTVHPFRLDRHRGVVLAVENDFAQPGGPHFEASLELLMRIGMNCTRISELTSLPDLDSTLYLLEEYGIRHVVQVRAPQDATGLKRIPPELDLHCLGVVEPRPGGPEGSDWRRMADHVRLSARLHGLGAKVATRLLYPLAVGLGERKSKVYRHLAKAGVKNLFEPLDWASYGIGFEALSGRDRPHRELFDYLAALQKEFWKADWPKDAPTLRSKHAWRETYCWPQGIDRCPYFGRLMYGFFLFASRLDGAIARPLWQTHGLDPFADGPEFVATLAHPGETTLYSTYNLEAIRGGVVDLRYAQQAYRLISRLLRSDKKERKAKGRKLRREFQKLIEPYGKLVARGKRIDLASPDPERRLRQTREALAELIVEAGE